MGNPFDPNAPIPQAARDAANDIAASAEDAAPIEATAPVEAAPAELPEATGSDASAALSASEPAAEPASAVPDMTPLYDATGYEAASAGASDATTEPMTAADAAASVAPEPVAEAVEPVLAPEASGTPAAGEPAIVPPPPAYEAAPIEPAPVEAAPVEAAPEVALAAEQPMAPPPAYTPPPPPPPAAPQQYMPPTQFYAPVAPMMAGARRDKTLPILLEVIPGLFGFYGIGWLVSGFTSTGLFLLIGGIIFAVIMVIVTILTLGLGAICWGLVDLIVVVISAIRLNARLDQGL